MHLMTFDADFDLPWGHQTWKQGKINSGMFADIEKTSCPLFRKSAQNPKITSQISTLKCTWWPLIPILTLYEVTQLGNQMESVQECLLMLISLVAPYFAKVPRNPKNTSQTTTLKCTWWPLTPILTLYVVTQLGKISSGMFADIDEPCCTLCHKSVHKSENYLSDHQSITFKWFVKDKWNLAVSTTYIILPPPPPHTHTQIREVKQIQWKL